MRRAGLIENFIADVRYALRTLRTNLAFTATSVTVLALAIGANTAMFSVLNGVLLKPLPYRSPEQLAMLWSEGQSLREGRPAYWNIEQWRQSQSFEDLAFFDPASVTLTTEEGAERISVARISPNFFSLLGVQPLMGRTFSPEEVEQRQHLALVSERFWQDRFGRSPEAVGASIYLDGHSSRIIGVMPATLLANADVWEPHTMIPDWEALRMARGGGPWFVVGRLRPDVAIERAQEEMSAIARRLDEQLPTGARNRDIRVVPLNTQLVGPKARLVLWMLTGAVFFVLLIASSNAASLSLARSAIREKEFAVRAALGASRARIAGQLIAESLTLAVISGALGVTMAAASIRIMLAVQPGGLARLDEVGLDPRALGWALVLCLLTGIVVGLTPALTTTRRSLKLSSGRSVAGGRATRTARRALVVTEFALAVMLLAGTGLLVRSMWLIQNVEVGFTPARVLSIQLSTPAGMVEAQRTNIYNQVLAEIASLPGAESAGIIGDLFISNSTEGVMTAEGSSREPQSLQFRREEVSDGLFETLAVPLLRGRFFSSGDETKSTPVVIVNNTMARRLWPDDNPVGRRFKFGPPDSVQPWFTVAGVVGDMRREGLENEPIPQMFEPLARNPSRNSTLLIRTSSDDPLKLVASVQAAVRRADKNVLVYGITSLENRLGNFLAARRFQTWLLVAFSSVALLIAAAGIFGLVQYSVATRTHEIGIRIAVGAPTWAIFHMVLWEGLKLGLTGLALGLVGASWLSQAISNLLFAVTPTDSLTFVSVSLLLIAVAAAACYFPAHRAMKIDPITALRQE